MNDNVSKTYELRLINEYIDLFYQLDQLNDKLKTFENENEILMVNAKKGVSKKNKLNDLITKNNQAKFQAKRLKKQLTELKNEHEKLINVTEPTPSIETAPSENKSSMHTGILKKELLLLAGAIVLIFILGLLSLDDLAVTVLLITSFMVLVLLFNHIFRFIASLIKRKTKPKVQNDEIRRSRPTTNEKQIRKVTNELTKVQNNITTNEASIKQIQQQLTFLTQQQNNQPNSVKEVEVKTKKIHDNILIILSQLQNPKYLNVIPSGFRDPKKLDDIRVILNSSDVVNLKDAYQRYSRMINHSEYQTVNPKELELSNEQKTTTYETDGMSEHDKVPEPSKTFNYRDRDSVIQAIGNKHVVYDSKTNCYIGKSFINIVRSSQSLTSLLKNNVPSTEVILFVLKGAGKEFFIVTNMQIMILKEGLLATGQFLGGQSMFQIPINHVTSLSYKSIGMASEGVLIVHAIGYKDSIVTTTEKERQSPYLVINQVENAMHLYTGKDSTVKAVVNWVNQNFLPLVNQQV